jgi:hypothetical protein
VDALLVERSSRGTEKIHGRIRADRLAALEHPLTEADKSRLEERYRARDETAQAEAFLRGEDDPAASAEERAGGGAVRAALVFLESYRELPRLTPGRARWSTP